MRRAPTSACCRSSGAHRHSSKPSHESRRSTLAPSPTMQQSSEMWSRAMGRAPALMRSHGDGGKQTWITEMGWASVPGPYFSGGSTQGQARLLSESYRGLIARRATQRIGLLAWFALRDHALAPGEADGWVFHTGLFTSSGAAKPAWAALVKLAGGRAGF